jgi:glutamate racemase
MGTLPENPEHELPSADADGSGAQAEQYDSAVEAQLTGDESLDPAPETLPQLREDSAVAASGVELADSENTDVIEVSQADAAGEEGGDQQSPAVSPGTRSQTVGIFDSGIGGFTVAGAILKRRPDLNLIYYADSVNLPYGGRSQEQLERFSDNIVEFLRERGAEVLADGCNTINRNLPGPTRTIEYGLPVFDLVEATIAWLHQRRVPQGIALLATQATVNAGYWEKRLGDVFLDVPVHPIAAPELVPLIEAPQPDEGALRHAVGKYLRLIRDTGADTVVLGCTHYPLLHSYFVEGDVYLSYVDPGLCLAEKLAAELPPAPAGAPPGRLEFYNSLPSERFYAMGERVFGRPIRDLTRMYIVNPYED